MHTEDEFRSLASDFHRCRAVLAALGDENRLHILYQMMFTAKPTGMRVGEIVRMSNLSRPAVSHHMKILKDAGVINVRREGTKNFYYLDPDMKSILSGYLIQCNDEPRNPFNDCESGSKWPQGVSSLKGTCMYRKSASEEALIGGICIEFQLCFPPILPFVTPSCRYTHRTARSRRRRSA